MSYVYIRMWRTALAGAVSICRGGQRGSYLDRLAYVHEWILLLDFRARICAAFAGYVSLGKNSYRENCKDRGDC